MMQMMTTYNNAKNTYAEKQPTVWAINTQCITVNNTNLFADSPLAAFLNSYCKLIFYKHKFQDQTQNLSTYI